MGVYKTNYRMQYAKKIGTSCAKNGQHQCIRGSDGPDECCAMACVDSDLRLLFRDALNSYAITIHVGSCNLDCKFCWAYILRNHKNEQHRNANEVFKDVKCKYECIVQSQQNEKSEPPSALIYSGLEPLASIEEIFGTLSLVAGDKQLRRLGILFRTNATLASNLTVSNNLKRISDLGLDCRFEVSLKGVNSQQFAWLTGKSSSLFKKQIEGYEQISQIFGEENTMLSLGIYHSKSGIKLGARKYDRFPLVLVEKTGEEMNFEDYSEDLKKPHYQALFAEQRVHIQYYELFQTTEGKGAHHPQRDDIIRISCPLGRTFSNLQNIAECQDCDDADCSAIKKRLRAW